jgi:hypothetical protein
LGALVDSKMFDEGLWFWDLKVYPSPSMLKEKQIHLSKFSF